ncbi:MAG: UbiA family prenyltransferase [Phycisphaeraceae bacterium]
MAEPTNDNPTPPRPLVVDLDGTLVSTDTLHELLLEVAGHHPLTLPRVLLGLLGGKAAFKQAVARSAELDPEALPYRDEVLALIREAKAEGRPVVLASASHRATVESVAAHIDLFDAALASGAGNNLKGRAKLAAIRALLDERGWGEAFDYVGDDQADLPIWAEAHTAYLVDVCDRIRRGVAPTSEAIELVERRSASALIEFARAARPYQWSKNLLLAVPLSASGQFGDRAIWLALVLSFVAFSLTASAVYLVNDLLDLRSDRLHPTKRHRPIAAGRLAPMIALLGAFALVAGSFTLSLAALPPIFTQVLAVYLVTTTAYSLYIKGKVMLDVIWLACLYTLRIIAGGVAVGIVASEWLLGFTLFTFLSLAFAKRFCELRLMLSLGSEHAKGRGYRTDDLPLVQGMGIGAGYLAVLVFALYITSDAVSMVYDQPQILWLACPLILYWMSRLWLFAHRGKLKGDPLLFALSDRISYFCIALLALVKTIAH